MTGNRLRGPLPAALALLTQLQTLRLSGNALSHTLPTALGQLTLLKRYPSSRRAGEICVMPRPLTASHHHFSHPSSPCPSLCGIPYRLYLDWNSFTGPVPPLPPSIRALSLAHNALSGPLPPLNPVPPVYAFDGNCGLTPSTTATTTVAGALPPPVWQLGRSATAYLP